MRVLAWEEAVLQYRRALAVIDMAAEPDDVQRGEMVLRLGQVLSKAGAARVAPPPARAMAHDLQPGAAAHAVTGTPAHTKAARDEWMKVIAVGLQGGAMLP